MLRYFRPRHSVSLARKPAPHGSRSISLLSSLPTVLVPPVVFGGLVVSLWAYKCAMMVLFQNKMIYMPGVPLGAKRETLADYRHLFKGIQWQENHRSIKTSDGKLLSFVTASTNPASSPSSHNNTSHILIVYFQGYLLFPFDNYSHQQYYSNASSTPPRLSYLSAILASLSKDSSAIYTFLVPSYRGYWTSTGAPSQIGIEKDLSAIFSLLESDPRYAHVTNFILWGQSIGCGIALKGWANYLERRPTSPEGGSKRKIEVTGLILETPFVSVPNMLRVLYPQKWLPYRYLSVFLRSTWDVGASAEVVRGRLCKENEAAWPSQSCKTDRSGRMEQTKNSQVHRVLVVSAGKDEVVPPEETAHVEKFMRNMVGKDCVRSITVPGALHVECATRPYGKDEIVAFLKSFDLRGLGLGSSK